MTKKTIIILAMLILASCSVLRKNRKCDGRKAIMTPMGKM